MIILLTLLISGIVSQDRISQASQFLLKFMPVFFIPAGVTIITCLPLIDGRVPQFALVCIITTLLVFISTSLTVVLIGRIQRYIHAKRNHQSVSLKDLFVLPIGIAHKPAITHQSTQTPSTQENEA